MIMIVKMTNLEFLKYLRENRIVDFEDNFNSNEENNILSVWDWDRWHEILIWFDSEGNIIENN